MGIAILWIMLFHGILLGLKGPNPLNFIIGKGNCGVEIFLLLSGVGLYYTYHKNSDIKRFYARRIKRVILPYFLIATPLWAIEDLILRPNVVNFFQDLTLYSFWTRDNETVWYIALIIPLYALFPLIYKWIYASEQRKSNINRCFILVALALSFVYALRYYEPEYFLISEIAFTRVPVFLIGVLIGSFAMNRKKITWGDMTLILLILVCGIYVFQYKTGVPLARYWYIGLALVVCFAGAGCLEFLETRYQTKPKVLAILGKYSLELYIVHMFIRLYIYQLKPEYNWLGINWGAYGILNTFMMFVISFSLVWLIVKFEKLLHLI